MTPTDIFFRDIYADIKKGILASAAHELNQGPTNYYYWAKKIVQLQLHSDDSIPASLINVSPSSVQKLTLLHIAVISINKIACLYLLNHGANPNSRDHRGWTPLHHAAIAAGVNIIHGLSLTSTLIEAGGDPSIKNDLFATAEKIVQFLNPLEETTAFCYWRREGQQKLEEMNSEKYRELTQSTFLSENYVELSYLIEDWKKPKQSIDGLFPFTTEIARKYPAYLKNRPKHVLELVLTDSSGVKLPFSPGLGLYSHGRFPSHAIVGEYIGVVSTQVKDSPYATSRGWDAKSYSSPPTRINCSFPNVAMMNLPASEGVEGLPRRMIFVSLEHVEGQFCWNYGAHHSVKYGPYLELRPKEMRDFVRNHSVDLLINSLFLEISDRCGDWKTYALAEKIRYIIQTPTALFLLTLEGLFNEEDAKKLHSFAMMSNLLPSKNETKECVNIAIQLRQLCQKISKNNAHLSSDIIKYFNQFAAQRSLKLFLDAAELVTITLKGSTDIPSAWESIKQTLSPRKPAEEPTATRFESKLKIPPNAKLKGKHFLGKRYAISGIGKIFSEEDIGKKFVRTCPSVNSFGVFDWSFVPFAGSLKPRSLENDSVQLSKIEGKCLRVYFFCVKEYSILEPEINDGNWIEAERYTELVNAILEASKPEDRERVWGENPPKRSFFESSFEWPDHLIRPKTVQAPIFNFFDDVQFFNDIQHLLPIDDLIRTPRDNEDWLKHVLANIPDQPATKIHHLLINVNHYTTDTSNEPQEPPQFDSNDPRAILGLPGGLKNLKTINARYRQLALQYHPDKPRGDSVIFVKIANAYEKLVKEIAPKPFTTDLSLSLESNYIKADLYIHVLNAMEADTAVLVDLWTGFIVQLTKLNEHLDKPNLSVNGLLIDQLMCKAKSRLARDQFKIACAGETLPRIDLTHENKIQYIQEALVRMQLWIKQFDLNNEQLSWLGNTITEYREVNWIFSDKYLSFQRSLGELYVVMNNKSGLHSLRKDVSKFYKDRVRFLKEGVAVSEREESKFQNQLSVLASKEGSANKQSSQQSRSESGSGSKTEATEEPRENKSVPLENKNDTALEVKINNVTDFERNFKRNLQFFSLNALHL